MLLQLYAVTGYENAEHQRLYEVSQLPVTEPYSLLLQDAKLAVRNGTLPVRLELAVILTATQIHIEELQRARAFATTSKPLPNVKVKHYFPEGLKVGSALQLP